MTTKEKLLTGSLVLALLVAIVPASDAFSRFSGMRENQEDRPSFEEMQERFQNQPSFEEMQKIRDSITRTVENIENGVEITITSPDAEAVAHLQENKATKEYRNEDVVHTVENLENGVKMTITSDDAEEVAKIQERAEEGGKRGKGGRHGGCSGHRGGGEKGEFSGGGCSGEGVEGECPFNQ